VAHLFVDISSHGFGHLAQTAPVLNELRLRLPDMRLTVRSGAPREVLAKRIDGEFLHIAQASDFGMVMANAVDVLAEPSAAAYRAFHQDWEAKVAHAASEMTALMPDLVLSNISYLTLAAAKAAGIPALAMCSINWADIYQHYCGTFMEAKGIHAQMLDAYRSAKCFIRPQPAMPMPGLNNTHEIGPIALVGTDRRSEIKAGLGLKLHDKLVSIAMGGIQMRLPLENWPRISNVRWLVPASWGLSHPDAITFETLGLPFVDVLRASDALITKPGYGSFAEAATNGIPVLYLRRRDWPEEPYLVDWLTLNGRCLEVERSQLERGDINSPLQALFAMPHQPPVAPAGTDEAAEILQARLDVA